MLDNMPTTAVVIIVFSGRKVSEAIVSGQTTVTCKNSANEREAWQRNLYSNTGHYGGILGALLQQQLHHRLMPIFLAAHDSDV
jgi:hypothetical protein